MRRFTSCSVQAVSVILCVARGALGFRVGEHEGGLALGCPLCSVDLFSWGGKHLGGSHPIALRIFSGVYKPVSMRGLVSTSVEERCLLLSGQK